jgi:hypothetical protein
MARRVAPEVRLDLDQNDRAHAAAADPEPGAENRRPEEPGRPVKERSAGAHTRPYRISPRSTSGVPSMATVASPIVIQERNRARLRPP